MKPRDYHQLALECVRQGAAGEDAEDPIGKLLTDFNDWVGDIVLEVQDDARCSEERARIIVLASYYGALTAGLAEYLGLEAVRSVQLLAYENERRCEDAAKAALAETTNNETVH